MTTNTHTNMFQTMQLVETESPAETWLRLNQPPKPVGSWTLDPNPSHIMTKFVMYTKPTDEQIKNTEEMFGWKWQDV